jgi:hypothetical protein
MGLRLLPNTMPGTASVVLDGLTVPFPMWISLFP